jgi:hypothetical protein
MPGQGIGHGKNQLLYTAAKILLLLYPGIPGQELIIQEINAG